MGCLSFSQEQSAERIRADLTWTRLPSEETDTYKRVCSHGAWTACHPINLYYVDAGSDSSLNSENISKQYSDSVSGIRHSSQKERKVSSIHSANQKQAVKASWGLPLVQGQPWPCRRTLLLHSSVTANRTFRMIHSVCPAECFIPCVHLFFFPETKHVICLGCNSFLYNDFMGCSTSLSPPGEETTTTTFPQRWIDEQWVLPEQLQKGSKGASCQPMTQRRVKPRSTWTIKRNHRGDVVRLQPASTSFVGGDWLLHLRNSSSQSLKWVRRRVRGRDTKHYQPLHTCSSVHLLTARG